MSVEKVEEALPDFLDLDVELAEKETDQEDVEEVIVLTGEDDGSLYKGEVAVRNIDTDINLFQYELEKMVQKMVEASIEGEL